MNYFQEKVKKGINLLIYMYNIFSSMFSRKRAREERAIARNLIYRLLDLFPLIDVIAIMYSKEEKSNSRNSLSLQDSSSLYSSHHHPFSDPKSLSNEHFFSTETIGKFLLPMTRSTKNNSRTKFRERRVDEMQSVKPN